MTATVTFQINDANEIDFDTLDITFNPPQPDSIHGGKKKLLNTVVLTLDIYAVDQGKMIATQVCWTENGTRHCRPPPPP